jgi:hypothetical protein
MFAVQGFATISNVSVNPTSQPAMSMGFVMYAQSNTGTTAHMAHLYVMFGNSNTNPQGQLGSSCIMKYSLPQDNGGYDDMLSTGGHGGATAWLHHTPPTSITPSSGSCTFNSGAVQASVSGGLVTFQMSGVTFPSSNTGLKYIWAYVGTMSETPYEALYPWTVVGTFTVGAPPLPVITMAGPTPGGDSATQTFTFYTNYQGATGGSSQFGITASNSFNGNGGCWSYAPQDNPDGVLLNDAGNGWSAPYSTGLQGNSQCDEVNFSQTGSSTNKTHTITLTFKPSFSGTRYIWGYAANAQNQANAPVLFGALTISVPQYQIIGYVKESPATLNPGEVNMSRVTLSQAGQNLDTMALRVYQVGDPVTFRIRFGRPNQQVWVQRRAMRFTDGAWIEEVLCSPTVGISGHEVDGGCLLGYTDATGFFEWNSQILNSLIGMTTVQFYLGSQTPDPAYPTTTYGPMNDDNYIGALVYFVIGVSGFPQPPVW